jgi:hypothetical protein
MKKPFLLAALFLLLPLFAIAQEIDPVEIPEDWERREQTQTRLIINPAIRASFETDPSGFFLMLLAAPPDRGATYLPGFKEEFGISEEQVERLYELIEAAEPENLGEIEEEILDPMLEKVLKDANYVPNEEEDAALDLLCKSVLEACNSVTTEACTAEQIQKMDGMILALTGGLESPFFNERHMAALDMTAEQKEKFKAINEATKPGREKMIAALSAEVEKMVVDEKFSFKGLIAALAEFKDFSRDLKNRRSEVLTPAQIAKVKTLTKLPKFLSLTNLLPKWAPSADSWKPGDPLPAGAVPPPPQPTGGTFPRTEN